MEEDIVINQMEFQQMAEQVLIVYCWDGHNQQMAEQVLIVYCWDGRNQRVSKVGGLNAKWYFIDGYLGSIFIDGYLMAIMVGQVYKWCFQQFQSPDDVCSQLAHEIL